MNLAISALLRKRLQIDKISAESMTILRKPSVQKEHPPPKKTDIRKLPDFSFEEIVIQQLKLEEPLLGWPATLGINGNIGSHANGKELMGRLSVTGDIHISAVLDMDWKKRLFAGNIDAELPDNPNNITGGSNTTANLHATLAHEHSSQDISLQMQAHNFQVHSLSLTNLSVILDMKNIFKKPAGTGEISGNGLAWNNLYVDKLETSGNTAASNIVFQSKCSGNYGADFVWDATGRLDIAENTSSLSITAANIEYGMLKGALKLHSSLKDNILLNRADLHVEPGGNIHAEANIPLHGYRQTSPTDNPQDALRIMLQSKLDLSTLSTLPAFANSSIAGNLSLNLSSRGWGPRMIIKGGCQLSEGYYENYRLGTIVRNISGEIVAADNHLEIRNFSASDRRSGRISLHGSADFKQGANPLLDVSMQANRFLLVDRPDVQSVASGNITTTGQVGNITMKGDIKLHETTVNLDRLPPPTPPVLIDSKEAKKQEAILVAQEQKRKTSTAWKNFSMDITLQTARPAQISGPSLKSMWNGKVTLSRKNGELSLLGEFNPRGGTISFIGRQFTFEHGSVRFDATWPPIPILDITLVHRRKELSAQLIITGRANNPNLSLESDPAMPEDEILSRILFGKNLSEVTPVQALQLASALRGLKSGRGVSFTDRLRETIGVDQIELRSSDSLGSDDQSGTVLAIGKYVTDSLYTEVNRDLDSDGDSRVRIEYEVRPNLTLETEAGIKMRPGFGINWKKDY
jgi:autotransporter translocation and assembly factor TamB